MSRLMFCQTVNVLSCIMFKAVRKPFSKQTTAGIGWIITDTLFSFNIYVEIEKYPYMTGIQTGLLTILTEMLTISGLRCDILDRNSPVTPLVRMVLTTYRTLSWYHRDKHINWPELSIRTASGSFPNFLHRSIQLRAPWVHKRHTKRRNPCLRQSNPGTAS